MAASIRSKSCPARPTNGLPTRSSSAPGASPTTIRRAPARPSEKTKLRAPAFSGEPSQDRITSANSSSVLADCASVCVSGPAGAAASGSTLAWLDALGSGVATGAATGVAGAALGWLSANRSCGLSAMASSAPSSICQARAEIMAARMSRSALMPAADPHADQSGRGPIPSRPPVPRRTKAVVPLHATARPSASPPAARHP